MMFGAEDRPPWDKDGTYMPDLIEVCMYMCINV